MQQSRPKGKTLYYERRPGQFFNKKDVIKTRVIKIQPQIKTFTAMFLDEPHNVMYFDKKLVDRIGKDIFNESHYPIAYYTSSLAFYQLDHLYKKQKITIAFENKKKNTPTKIKYYLLMIFKYIAIDSECPSYKNKKNIEKYCNEMIDILDDIERAGTLFIQSYQKLDEFAEQYSKLEKNLSTVNYDELCNQSKFTNFILKQIKASNKNLSKERQNDISGKQQEQQLDLFILRD